MTSQELRQKFIDFFLQKNHKLIPNASLIPENDPTTLFISAGMHPLVPYLLGEPHPLGKRLVGIQKCLRTDDIGEVGDKVHHTFFEMLGNWSLGDYWKKEAIEWSFEFLTSKDWLGIDREKLAVSVFAGDKDAPFDQGSYDLWLGLGISKDRIAKLPKENNWWGPPGETGPCGPDTEIFVWAGGEKAPEKFDPDNPEWIEVWNDVFMEYDRKIKNQKSKIKNDDFEFVPLKQKNVDTGMGFERMLAVLNGLDDDYQTELFWPVIQKIAEISGKKYKENLVGFRIIADHLRAATFALAEEVTPSNVGQGYILRRLIRRAIRYGKQLGIDKTFTSTIANTAVNLMKDAYSELLKHEPFITEQLTLEEEKFKKTIKEGLKKAQKILDNKVSLKIEKYSKIMQTVDKKEIFREIYRGTIKALSKFKVPVEKDEIQNATISGKEAFDLYQTFGFPIEMIIELAQEKNLLVDIENYREEVKKHQELSRTASAGMFKGGLGEQTEIATKYHTATHLLQAALRQILGAHVGQKGSNITAERLRFDFSHPEKISSEQIKKVEDLVNQKIKENLPVSMEMMTLEEAKEKGALAVFEGKYGEKVKVYSIGPFSREVCGGPHTDFTGSLGKFKIIKEEVASSGVRRIYAVLKHSA